MGRRTTYVGVFLVAMATLINPVDPEVETSLPSRLQELGTQGIQTVQGNAAPLPMDPGLMWLGLVALALVLLLTELLVNGLEQPAWSICASSRWIPPSMSTRWRRCLRSAPTARAAGIS